MALLAELEAELPVATWNARGIHVWPLARLYLAFDLLDFDTAATPAGGTAGLALRTLGRAARARRAAWCDRARAARPDAPGDVLFLGDGQGFERVDGLWLDKLCDPLIAALAERGVGATLLERGDRFWVPRHTPSAYVLPAIERALIRAKLKARRAGPVAMPGLAAALTRRFDGRYAGIEATIGARLAMVEALAATFRGWLAGAGARLGVIVDYYSPVGMAFNLACHQLGLVAVDLQHGLAGELHAAYGRWTRVPEGGYAMLPRAFWCWTAEDAAAVRAWGAMGLAGGNPALALGADPGADEAIARLGADAAARVVVTLQGIEPPAELERLAKAIAAHPRWFWWLRPHPLRPQQAEQLAALAARHGLANVEIARAASFSLPALLRHAELHATGFSAAVLEAEALGVPSVVWHPDARELLAAPLARGSARYADAVQDLGAALEACWVPRAGPPRPAALDGGSLAGLLALLAPPPARGL